MRLTPAEVGDPWIDMGQRPAVGVRVEVMGMRPGRPTLYRGLATWAGVDGDDDVWLDVSDPIGHPSVEIVAWRHRCLS